MRIVTISLILLVILTACNSVTRSETPTSNLSGVTIVPDKTATASEVMTSSPTARSIIADCPNAPPIRLIVQERGQVLANDDRTLNLRDGAGTSFDVVLAIEPNEIFFVLNGPECDGTYAWFRVQYGTGIGWIAEGDDQAYYVEPYLPG
jgi:uncharacterized protein YgiM (DUF1202 family)